VGHEGAKWFDDEQDNKSCKKEEVIKTGPSVMSFEDWLASGSQGICDLFGEFIERTYGDGFRRVPGRIL
jgi:hypothetical protein